MERNSFKKSKCLFLAILIVVSVVASVFDIFYCPPTCFLMLLYFVMYTMRSAFLSTPIPSSIFSHFFTKTFWNNFNAFFFKQKTIPFTVCVTEKVVCKLGNILTCVHHTKHTAQKTVKELRQTFEQTTRTRQRTDNAHLWLEGPQFIMKIFEQKNIGRRVACLPFPNIFATWFGAQN